MIVFQGVVTILSAEYDGVRIIPLTGISENTEDILTDEEMKNYAEGLSNPDTLVANTFPIGSLIVMTAIGLLGLGMAIVSRSLVPFGAGMFIAVVTGLYIGVADVVFGINFVNSPIITGISALIAVVIGILATITIVEMFTAQQGAN